MTAQDVITLVDSVKPNPFDQATKLSWINEVEGDIYQNILKPFKSVDIQLKKDISSYSLPSDCKFPFIDSATRILDNCYALNETGPTVIQLNKIDARSVNKTGYYADGSSIGIYPVPTQDDDTPSLRVIYLPEYTNKLITDTLSVPKPYDRIYSDYVLSKIDWFNQEFINYNNSSAQYNADYANLAKFYNNNGPIPNYAVSNLW